MFPMPTITCLLCLKGCLVTFPDTNRTSIFTGLANDSFYFLQQNVETYSREVYLKHCLRLYEPQPLLWPRLFERLSSHALRVRSAPTKFIKGRSLARSSQVAGHTHAHARATTTATHCLSLNKRDPICTSIL